MECGGQGQTVVTVRYPITTSTGEVLRTISHSPCCGAAPLWSTNFIDQTRAGNA